MVIEVDRPSCDAAKKIKKTHGAKEIKTWNLTLELMEFGREIDGVSQTEEWAGRVHVRMK